jgi:hypothetical protein
LEAEGLAHKWGFPAELHATVGSGLSDEIAASLPLPKKDELLRYVCASYEVIEQLIEQLDEMYPNFENRERKCHWSGETASGRPYEIVLQRKVASLMRIHYQR